MYLKKKLPQFKKKIRLKQNCNKKNKKNRGKVG